MNGENKLQTALENITTIPTLPSVIKQITTLMQNPKTSAEEVGNAITKDPALAAKVLKLVNSAFYGFPGRIGTITHAIVILGFSTVKNVVLTASIFETMKRGGAGHIGFDMKSFWMHSISCGAAAQCLAKLIGHTDKEECFIGGLIHDVGKVICSQYLPAEFGEIASAVRKKEILYYDAEVELFDMTHQEIGGLLTERWNLPKALQYAVRHHHQPLQSREHYTISAIVHCADIFVRGLDLGNGGDAKIPIISEQVWKDFRMDSMDFDSLFETISEEVEKATVFLELI